MTTKQILNLDCRKREDQEKIQKVLRQIKPLSRYSDGCDIPLYAIEKVITIICKKYGMRIREIIPDMHGNEQNIIWEATLQSEKNFKNIGCVYGISMYELLAKAAILMYAEVKKRKERR